MDEAPSEAEPVKAASLLGSIIVSELKRKFVKKAELEWKNYSAFLVFFYNDFRNHFGRRWIPENGSEKQAPPANQWGSVNP